jgi:cytochrome d ubiquinol oxidase subunit II
VLRFDAKPLYHGLVHGRGLVALLGSVVAGAATLALVAARRYEPARYTAAAAAGAIVTGWALAQSPVILPRLTVDDAAAPRETLVSVIVATLAGAVILLPALTLLFRLFLGGRFDPEAQTAADAPPRVRAIGPGPRLMVRLAVALLIVGAVLTTFADSRWAHAVGVTALLAFVAVAFPVALPPDDVTPPPPG